MNLKTISNILLLFFCFSCSPLNNIGTDKDKISSLYVEENENNEIINNEINLFKSNFIDHYNQNNIKWLNEVSLNEIFKFKEGKRNNQYNKDLNTFIIDNKIFYFKDSLTLEIYDLISGKRITKQEINIEKKNNFSNLISVVNIDNYFYAAFSDGLLIKLDFSNKILWNVHFDDLLRTPIKIHNKNLIILLSNKIISVDSISGKINWEFLYIKDNPLNFSGGLIVSKNHLLYFILPNNKLGEIDTLLGEKIFTSFSQIKLNNGISLLEKKLHSFGNFLSFFENNKFLYTFDIKNEVFLLEKKIIENVNSYYFINNSLIILDTNMILKAINIRNNKIFWKLDINNFLKIDEKIVKVINNEKRIIIFFTNGLILEIDQLNGKVLFDQKIQLKKIDSLIFYNNYLIFREINGKITFFNQ